MYVYTKITLYKISIQYSMDYIDAKRVPTPFGYGVVKESFVEHFLKNGVKYHHATNAHIILNIEPMLPKLV